MANKRISHPPCSQRSRRGKIGKGRSEFISKKYCFSLDKERFDGEYDTRQEAIDEGFESTDSDSIMTGVAVPFDCSIADTVIYKLQEKAYEEAGDVTQDWLAKVSSEAQEDLNDAIKSWLKRHNLEPKFSCVDEIETHEREEEYE